MENLSLIKSLVHFISYNITYAPWSEKIVRSKERMLLLLKMEQIMESKPALSIKI